MPQPIRSQHHSLYKQEPATSPAVHMEAVRMKRAATMTYTSQPLKKQSKPDLKYFGVCGNVKIYHDGEAIVLKKMQRRESSFWLYRSHLKKMQALLPAILTTIQEERPEEFTLGKYLTLTLTTYSGSAGSGTYVELGKQLSDDKIWTVSLKMSEFMFLIEHLSELITKLQVSTMPANDLFDAAITTYADCALSLIPGMVQDDCNGCKIQHPSQRQHNCLEQDPDTIEAVYLDKAIDRVKPEEFCKSLRDKVKPWTSPISPWALWQMCRLSPQVESVKRVVMIPYRLPTITADEQQPDDQTFDDLFQINEPTME